MRRLLALATATALFGCAQSDDGTAPAAVEEPAPVAPAPEFMLEHQRASNHAAYVDHYLPNQADLHASNAGKWLAVAGGRVVPTSDGALAPAESMREADLAASAAEPGAQHRYVFQIGEEGDIEWPMGGCELKHVIGTFFMAETEELAEADAIAGKNPIEQLFAGISRDMLVPGPEGDSRMFIQPRVGAPGEDGEATAKYCVATGFAGYAVMTGETAAGLEAWEIPGMVNVHGVFASGTCRRARARFTWPDRDGADFTVPVAVWPQ